MTPIAANTPPPPDHEHQAVPSDMTLRVKAIESLLVEKGLVDPAALDALVDTYEHEVGPRNGAQVVARAWVDAAYKQRLLTDAPAAIAEFGYLGTQGDHMVVVENTPGIHSLVVCTLCSCYPWPVLGQLFVCNGCCCGQIHKGFPASPLDEFKRQWKARGIRRRFYLTISGCLGPCPLANVVMIQFKGHSAWFHSINHVQDVAAIYGWVEQMLLEQTYLDPPSSLAARHFQRYLIDTAVGCD
jgi:hypothetical protein